MEVQVLQIVINPVTGFLDLASVGLEMLCFQLMVAAFVVTEPPISVRVQLVWV
ncbi:hypothetical protein U1Q18_030977, partial [Sarracenia purpurea var. burkii]